VLTALVAITAIVLLAALALIAVIIFRVLARGLRGLLFDRALTNNRTSLPPEYELPRYLEPSSGPPDPAVRWPGWDGWYFFMIPDDQNLPVKMIRASIMTGLYGLQGVDDYQELLLRLSTFDAVEHLVLTPTEIAAIGGMERTNYLSHRYLPKRSDLSIKRDTLDVAVTGAKVSQDQRTQLYGRIQGSWPNYQFEFINPEAEIKISLACKARNIVWWADIPEVFTYFAAFGDFTGTITYRRGTHKDHPEDLMHREETYALRGRGSFEHGCARRPFDFDSFWFPVRAIGAIMPRFKAIRYQYELFLGDQDFHGGFMLARGFGINFRNLGGFYLDGAYRRIKNVRIEYFQGEDDEVGTCQGAGSATFHRKWKVRAVTDDGILEYTGRRDFPPAGISSNMTYYNFLYAGTYAGKAISGRGYGEYLSM
jgi:hypothetical protein